MAKTNKHPVPNEPKTLSMLAEEILVNTPKQSILDATSLGIWSIVEQSGILAGAWKRHRIFMEDLDTEQVAAALGAIFAAMVQTTAAIGMDLETVIERQIEQLRTAPTKKGTRVTQPHIVKQAATNSQR